MTSPFLLSISVTVSAAALSFVLGCTAAWKLYEKRGAMRAVLDVLFCLPMVLPPTATGLFILVFLGRESAVGKLLYLFNVQIVFTPAAAVLASFLVAFPLMYRAALAAFSQVNKCTINAARTLGLSETKIFFKVLAPAARHGLLAGLALSGARALGEFGASLMAAGNIPGKTRTMPLALYYAYASGDTQTAVLYAASLTAISFFLLLAIHLLGERGEKA